MAGSFKSSLGPVLENKNKKRKKKKKKPNKIRPLILDQDGLLGRTVCKANVSKSGGRGMEKRVEKTKIRKAIDVNTGSFSPHFCLGADKISTEC